MATQGVVQTHRWMRCCDREGSNAYSPNLMVQPSAHSKLLHAQRQPSAAAQTAAGHAAGWSAGAALSTLLAAAERAGLSWLASQGTLSGCAACQQQAGNTTGMGCVQASAAAWHMQPRWVGTHSMRVQYMTPRTSMPSLSARSSCGRRAPAQRGCAPAWVRCRGLGTGSSGGLFCIAGAGLPGAPKLLVIPGTQVPGGQTAVLQTATQAWAHESRGGADCRSPARLCRHKVCTGSSAPERAWGKQVLNIPSRRSSLDRGCPCA